MRAYYYLLFRLYNYFESNFDNQDKGNAILRVTATSTVIVYAGLFTIALYLDYFDLIDFTLLFPYQYSQVIIIVPMGLINYYFVRQTHFLSINLEKGIFKDILLIIGVLLIILAYVNVTKKDEAKMEKQKVQNSSFEKIETPYS